MARSPFTTPKIDRLIMNGMYYDIYQYKERSLNLTDPRSSPDLIRLIIQLASWFAQGLKLADQQL